ncbi:MAG: hypothetical protein R2874_15630 [Desulfobacterales bacterium]
MRTRDQLRTGCGDTNSTDTPERWIPISGGSGKSFGEVYADAIETVRGIGYRFKE